MGEGEWVDSPHGAADGGEGVAGGKAGAGLSCEADSSAGVPTASPSPVYGGRGARNRELAAANQASPVDGSIDAAVFRRKRNLPFLGGGLPMQVLAGVRRPRRPRHLRGKVNPGS